MNSNKTIFNPAIAELRRSILTMDQNEPINRREGNTEQANLERTNRESFKAAIKALRRKVGEFGYNGL